MTSSQDALRTPSTRDDPLASILAARGNADDVAATNGAPVNSEIFAIPTPAANGYEQDFADHGATVSPSLLGRTDVIKHLKTSDKTDAMKDMVDDMAVTVGLEIAASQDNEHLTDMARFISWLSVLVSILMSALGIGFGFAEDHLSLIGFGGEAFLDSISSGLVLWRFKRPKARDCLNAPRKDDERSARRERNSSIGIGVLFILLALFLLMSAAVNFFLSAPHASQDDQADAATYGTILAWAAAIIFGLLAVAKWWLARQLRSQVLEKDALCSLLGAVLGLIVGITGCIEAASKHDPEGLAAVDPASSSIIALILLCEGLRTLWHNRSLVDSEKGHASNETKDPVANDTKDEAVAGHAFVV